MICDKKEVRRIALLFTLMYMISYITRINYGAIIAEMVVDTGYTKALLSMALTGSFITYGVGQIVSGICGDYFSPKKLLSIGLGASVLMNLLIPFCPNPYFMLAVWCVNGFAQAFMWPPLVRLMSALLSDEDYKRVSVRVSLGSSIGTIVVYLIAPLCIRLAGWRSVFFFSALCGILMLIFWQIFGKDTEKKREKREEVPSGKGAEGKKGLFFFVLMAGVMLSIVLQGLLRDGVTTWMPSYISETYELGSSVSILTGVVLPIFGILCFELASFIYRKKLKNPMVCAGLFFGIGLVSALALNFVSGTNAIPSVLFSAMLTGSMHGVNLILICMIPPFFKGSGKVSTVSGVLNSCTSIGSALSTYGVAVLSDEYGWPFTLAVWAAIAALGTLMCLLCALPFKKKFMNT
ncbi:MAG: MFS transporter [Clostridia bacterium]|nr:MFS transporter [Clostridia bacterium]